MTDTLSPPERSLDADGTIIVDLPCRDCGYNLRGLHKDARCPECAAPVAESLAGFLLRFAQPEWLERVALGARIAAGGITAISFTLVALVLTPTLGLGSVMLALIWMGVGLMVDIAGSWLILRVAPGVRSRSLRDVPGRATIMAWLAASVISVAVAAGSSVALTARSLLLRHQLAALFALSVASFAITMFIWHLALLNYLRDLVLRVPAPRAAKFLGLVQAGLIIGTCFAIPAYFVGLLLRSDRIVLLAEVVVFLLLASLFLLYPVALVVASTVIAREACLARSLSLDNVSQ